MPEDYGAEFDTLQAPASPAVDYGSEFDSLIPKPAPGDYAAEFDALPKKSHGRQPTLKEFLSAKPGEVIRTWYGMPVGDTRDLSAALDRPDVKKLASEAEGFRMVTGILPDVTPNIVQDAMDVFAASGPGPHKLSDPSKEPGTTAKVVSGAQQALVSAIGGLTEPEMAAVAAIPAGGLIGRLVSLGFGADMLSHMPAQVAELKKATEEKDTERQVEATVGLLLNGLFAGISIKHGLRSEPVIRDLAEHVVNGTDPGPAGNRLREEINKARSEGPSPEFRSLFGGIEPEIAGTTPAKVQEFARSMGMEWRPTPKPAEDIPAATETITRPAAKTADVVETSVIKPQDAATTKLTPGETAMLDVMSPAERQDYLTRKGAAPVAQQPDPPQINETPPPASPVVQPPPSPVVAQEQAQGLPAAPEGVRPTITTPPAALQTSGTVELVDLSTVKALNLDPHKTAIAVNFDPVTKRAGQGTRKPGPVQAHLALTTTGKHQGLSIQVSPVEGGPLITAWRANIQDLVQSGVLDDQGNNRFNLDLDRLYASPFLERVDERVSRRELASFKLPTERMERTEGVQSSNVVRETKTHNPFAGAIMQEFQDAGMLNDTVIKNLARTGAGGRIERDKSGKVAVKLGQQMASGLQKLFPAAARSISFRIRQLQDRVEREGSIPSILAEIETGKGQLVALDRIHSMLKSGGKQFTDADAKAAATFISDTDAFDQLRLTVEETKHRKAVEDTEAKVESIGTGEEVQFRKAQAAGNADQYWDDARTERMLGRIEDTNPALYRSFAAPLENTKAWAAIKEELIKFVGGDAVNADILFNAIQEWRAEGGVPYRDLTQQEAARLKYNNVKQLIQSAAFAKWNSERTETGPNGEQYLLFQIVGPDGKVMGEQAVDSSPASVDRYKRQYGDKNFDLSKVALSEWRIEALESVYSYLAQQFGNFPLMLPEGAAAQKPEWKTSLSATGKAGIISLMSDKNVRLDPKLRALGLQLLNKLPDKYLEDLSLTIDENGTAGGEFIPWLNAARIMLDTVNPEVAAHEIAHSLARFLTGKERGQIAVLRAAEIALIENNPYDRPAAEWLKQQGGSSLSSDYARWAYGVEIYQHLEQPFDSQAWSITDPFYHLINDDEYLAHYMSEAAGRTAPPELEGIIAKVKDILRRIIQAIKDWFNQSSTSWKQHNAARDKYFDDLLNKFANGEFDANVQGGMLFEKNNLARAKSLSPIKSLKELQRYTDVEPGVAEQQMVRTLTHEQNHPLVAHARESFGALPADVRAELTGIQERLDTLTKVQELGPIDTQPTPLKGYVVLVNALAIKQEGLKLSGEIQGLLDKLKEQAMRGERATLAQTQASQLDETVQDLISSYRQSLLAQRDAANARGVEHGLTEAIKHIDRIQKSSDGLRAAVMWVADNVSLADLMAGKYNPEQLITLLTNLAAAHEGSIPARGGMPGFSSDALNEAVAIMQSRQELVQDIITYKELSDPAFEQLMKTGEIELNKQIAGSDYKQLRSFIKNYRTAASAKDKARKIYLKHRSRMKDLIERLEIKTDAEEFLYGQVIQSPQFREAESLAVMGGFRSAELIRDNDGVDVLRQTYYNPLKPDESVDIVDASTREAFLKNEETFNKVAGWFEDALADPNIDPLKREAMIFELNRIYQEELFQSEGGRRANVMYDPRTGKRINYPFSPPNIIANLVGRSLVDVMQKIGGRAAVQRSAVFQARSEARRRTADVMHQMTYPLQQKVLDATKGHQMTRERWGSEVANPILASFNSIGAKQLKTGDTTRFGHRIKPADIEAIRAMKEFMDAMIAASNNMDLETAKLHPLMVKERVFGREILRPQQGGTINIMPRKFDDAFIRIMKGWQEIKRGRKTIDVLQQLTEYMQSGPVFNQMFLGHVYAFNRYPDYDYTTPFKAGYREIYKRIMDGQPPANFGDAVDIIFNSQADMDVMEQMTKEEIAKAIIVSEMDSMSNRNLDQYSQDRPTDTPGKTARITTGDNFMTKPRGKMIAPDGAYEYTILSDHDARWAHRQVLIGHEEIARNGLVKIQKMLYDYKSEWEDRAKHPDAQKESRQLQLSGEDWLNYNESKQLLNQINKQLNRLSPDYFNTFIDEQASGIARKGWSTLIQSLLQSATVLKNNFLGMNLRQWQTDQQWRADGTWMGMPRWLLKMPGLAKQGIVYPMLDIPRYILDAYAHRKVVKNLKVKSPQGKDLFGEEALRAVINNPAFAQTIANQVGGAFLQRAIFAQRVRDLGGGSEYGIKNQVMRYIRMFQFGGSLEHLDPTIKERLLGGAESLLGLFQETGAGLILPRALAPRKLEQFLNFKAALYGQRLLEELELNIKEAIKSRADLGLPNTPITDAELLGDSKNSAGNALYMRRIFSRASINLDAVMQRLRLDTPAELLTPPEWNSFILEVLKELNMPSADNRVMFKSGFGQLMSSLMGYGFWYNEIAADAMAHSSRKQFDVAALYRAMFFFGALFAMGIFIGTPLQRLLKRKLYNEEDQTGYLSDENTSWRNAAVLWQQTAPFWPVTGSIFNSMAQSGGNKIFSFLPITATQQLLKTGNEIAQTGHAFYPLMKLSKAWMPNTKIWINRMPDMEGAIDVNNAARILRATASGNIEVRTPTGGGGTVRYSPISTQMQLAVNELSKERPDYNAINHYRANAVQVLTRKGSTLEDAQRRFDLGVLVRFPENTVFGRTLTQPEKLGVLSRLTPAQAANLNRVESAFDRFATTYGLRPPSAPRKARAVKLVGARPPRRSRTRRARIVRNRSLLGRRQRRLLVA